MKNLSNLLCALFFTLTSLPSWAQCGVSVGAVVQVINTGAQGLRVRSGAGTNYIQTGGEFNSAIGTVQSGPTSANGYNWWQIKWFDGSCTLGYSIEGSGGTCYLQAIGTLPASLTSPAAYASIAFPQTFSWSSSCSLRVGFATSSNPSTVYYLAETGGNLYVSSADWIQVKANIGTASTYYWTVGEVIGPYFYARAGWRPFLESVPETISIPGVISGEANPVQGSSYSYTVGASTSSLGHTVEYSFNWGDGTSSAFSILTSAPHAWSNTGQKYIIVTARCQTHTTVTANNSPGNYVTVQAAISTLTVASSTPNSGVNITGYQLDNNNNAGGTTTFNRVFNQNTPVSFSAPTTASGNVFQKWQKDGVDLTTSTTANVTMDANHTIIAIFTPIVVAPTVQTLPPSSVTAISATLNGQVTSDGGSTILERRIEWAKSTGTWGTGTSGVDYGFFSDATSTFTISGNNFSLGLTGFAQNTGYKYRVWARNSTGWSDVNLVNVVTFTTGTAQPPPSVQTLPASPVTSSSATLNGSVNPNGASTTFYFQYGLTTGYGSTTSFGNTSVTLNVGVLISGLTANTIYHYQIVANNSGGPAYGLDQTFQTAPASIQNYGTVSGQVFDGTTGNPITGALVQLGASSTTSGAQGFYSFSSVATGNYTIGGGKSGYSSASYSVTVNAASSLSRIITLTPTSGSGSLPTVTSIKSKYADSSYFLDGVLFNVSFTANVDWAGHTPGTVQFITPHNTYTVAASGPGVSQTLAMGSDFGPGGHLQVVAVSGDGAKSSAKLSWLTVMPNPLPGPLGLLWTAEDGGSDFNYEQTTLSAQSFIDAGVGNGIIPSDIPLFGSKDMNLGFLPEVSYKATSGGQMNISMAWSDLEAGNVLNDTWKNGNVTDLTDKLNNFINIGTLNKLEVPHAGFGDLNLSFYPIIGGGWQYDNSLGQWKWRNAELGMAGDFSIQQTWPFAAGFVPMFAKVKFDLNAQFTGQLLNTTPISLNLDANLNPSLRGSLGVGISEVVSVEGWVQGGLVFDVQYPTIPTIKDASVNVTAGATFYYLLGYKEWSLPPKSWDIYSGPLALPQLMIMQPSSSLRTLGRGYMNYASTGVMGRSLIKPLLFGVGDGLNNPEILMSPVIPFCDPNCSSIGTNCYLVFLEDNTNRTSMNRTMAMFSQYNGTLWSAPVALSDDGTADFHPRVQTFSDGSAVAAWENEGTLQPDAASLTDMETNLEVSVAWFNASSKTWQPALRMTTNNILDRSPKLAGRSPDNVLLTWVSNPENDINGSSTAPNQIWFSKWNGSVWSAPLLAATFGNALVKYDLAYDGTNANIVMSLDTVDNSTNANGHELFRLPYQNGTWGMLTALTSDQTPNDNPQMSFDPQGNIVLTWLKGAELSSALNFNMADRLVVRTNGYSSNLADFKLASSSDGKLALLWSEPSENNADLFTMFYDPVFQTWGSPRQLTHDPQAERSTTAAFYGTNEVIAVYNRSMVSSTNSVNTTLADLAAYYYKLDEDLALDGSQFNANPVNPTPGSTATLTAEVLNLGDKVETNVVVAFYLNAAQPASEIGRVTLTNAIPPQGTNFVSFIWQVPATNSPVTVIAIVDPDQTVSDVLRSNNIAQLYLVRPNTEIKSMTWSQVASNLLALTVNVINDGAISNGPTTISLNQGSASGPNLFNQGIGSLAPGQSQDVIFVWNTTGLPDNMSVYAVLSGSGISNNFSAGNTTSALVVSQVPPPWIGSYQYLINGGFQIQLYGTVGRDYTLLASTDLVNWTPVLNFNCTNAPMSVVDPGANYLNKRFYRVAQGTLPITVKLNPGALPFSKTNGLMLNLDGPLGFTYIIQTSTNLTSWQPWTNFTTTSQPFNFKDWSATNFTQRFYRAVLP